jgi:DNA-binding XRE family transcriptional regulator
MLRLICAIARSDPNSRNEAERFDFPDRKIVSAGSNCRILFILGAVIADFSKKVKTNVLSTVPILPSILKGMQGIPLELSDAFARIVEKHRNAKGLSRAALAAKAGLHQTYIGLLERGKRSPNLDTAQAIAQSLGTSLSRMIAEAEKIRSEKE